MLLPRSPLVHLLFSSSRARKQCLPSLFVAVPPTPAKSKAKRPVEAASDNEAESDDDEKPRKKDRRMTTNKVRPHELYLHSGRLANEYVSLNRKKPPTSSPVPTSRTRIPLGEASNLVPSMGLKARRVGGDSRAQSCSLLPLDLMLLGLCWSTAVFLSLCVLLMGLLWTGLYNLVSPCDSVLLDHVIHGNAISLTNPGPQVNHGDHCWRKILVNKLKTSQPRSKNGLVVAVKHILKVEGVRPCLVHAANISLNKATMASSLQFHRPLLFNFLRRDVGHVTSSSASLKSDFE